MYPLHTCLFNLERCNREGGLLSSGDDHVFAFSTKGYRQNIHRGCQYPFVKDGSQLLSK